MMEPFLILDELIIPNSQLDVKNFFESHFFFFFQDEWIRLVTYPILDELIIQNSQLDVKNFFKFHFFFQADIYSKSFLTELRLSTRSCKCFTFCTKSSHRDCLNSSSLR